MNVNQYALDAAGSGPFGPDRVAAPVAEQQSEPFIRQFGSLLRRRKWVVLTSILVTLLLGLALVLLLPKKYTAETTLEIKREKNDLVSSVDGDRQSSAMGDQEFYQTQFGLLRSRTLAERVVVTLNLHNKADFFEKFKVKPTTKAGAWFENGRPVAATRGQRIRVAGQVLLDELTVDPGRLSRLVDITFTSPDPALSQQVVNAWGDSFIKLTLQRRYDATSYARRFLENRLTATRQRMNESEQALVRYAGQEGIINLPSEGATGDQAATSERSLVADDLSTLNRELGRAKADRIQAESRLQAGGGQVVEGLSNSAINELRQQRAQKTAEYAKLMVQFEPNYPPAKAMRSEMAQLDRSISQEEARVKSSVRQTYEAAAQREDALAQQVDRLKTGFLDFRRRSIQYNIYQREVDTNRQLYDALLQNYKQVGVAGGVGINNISIVDSAELPQTPSSPKVALILALSVVAGLLIGSAIALILEQADQGVNDPSQVEAMFGYPLLGAIPLVKDEDPKDALRDVKSQIMEAYRSVQLNLSFATDHGMPRTLAVTSSRPSEGKSTTIYALAQLLARLQRSVVLVDADMRIPNAHRIAGLKNERGLSNYLVGENDLHDMIQPTDIPKLSVLTSGPIPLNAPELLAGDRFPALLLELGKHYDHVLVDAPPVLGLADTPLIGSRVEGTIFVIEAHTTERSLIQDAVGRMNTTRAKIFGIVVMKFNNRRSDRDYAYSSSYSYSYGTAKQQD